MLKKVLLGLAGLVVLVLLGVGGYVMSQVSAFDQAIAKKYDLPIPQITLSQDPAVLERGKHLAESLGGCMSCHGENFGGGKVEDLGPLGKIVHFNVTAGKGGRLAEYTDGELARLLRHGVKKDGTSARLMPAQEFWWWPDEDRVALISYLRTVPPVDGQPGQVEFSTLAKVLDRMDSIPIDQARRVDHVTPAKVVPPSESAEYGAQIAHICHGCHNPALTGGPIPGAPPNFGIPKNLTPHETGLKDWTYDDFRKVVTTGVKRDGSKLSEFMPVESFKNWNETELKALWAHLGSLPPRPTGAR